MFAKAGDIASLSVRRPVLALVLSLLIVVAGAAAFLGVQVRELPEIDRPVISVSVAYPGASPETVDTEVTSVIEGAAARVPGVVSLSSTSRYGRARVVAEFGETVDMNVAAGDLREAVGAVRRRLPDTAEEPMIVKADTDAQPIIQLAVTSDSLSVGELTALVEDRVADRLAAVEGVADVQTFGVRRYVMAVTVDAAALAARGLSVEDVQGALREVAMDAPAGSLDAGGQTLVVRANAAAAGADEISATFIDPNTRVGDVAQVGLVPADRQTALRSNGRGGIGLGIIRQAQSNTLTISRDVRAAIGALNAEFAGSAHIELASDEGVFIEGAVREVVRSLLIATVAVVAVIFVFLRSGRATLIPAVTVPVAVIGTLAGIWLAGFSINLITLLALVLATGLVVDDAIVVLENIVRRRAGMGPRAAAVVGTREVFFAVIATTATLAAVFIPISFFPGTAGRLFAEFGFVLAIAVTLSSLVALTLCPMLASRLLAGDTGGEKPEGPVGRTAGRFGAAVAGGYARSLEWALRAPVVVLALAVTFAAGAWGLYRTLPEELTPREDRGVVVMMVRAPQGASLEYTEAKVREVEAVARRLVQRGEATGVFSIVGRGSVNQAFVTVPLAHWDARARGQEEINAELTRDLGEIVGIRTTVRTPNSLGIRGGGSGLQFAVTGSNYPAIAAAAQDMVEAIEDRLPGLVSPMISFDTTQPQLSVNIDRERAADLGISVESVSAVLQTMLDGRDAGQMFIDDEAVPLRLRAPEGQMLSPADLESLFVRTREGGLVPLSSVVAVDEMAISPSLAREGQMRALALRAGLGEGQDMRSAMTEVEALAREVLPPGMGVRFLSEAAALDETARALMLTFAFAFLVVLLVLAAQFESFLSALITMVTVPFGLAAAPVAMALTGGTLNIYSQIGLLMLVGLMAKNGILIVEFANQLRDRGLGVAEAIREASAVRFRPVMMTLVSTVLGGVPLVLGFGAGAESRAALGWVIVGGLGLSTVVTLYLTPVAYSLLAAFTAPRASEARRLGEELAEAERAGAREPARAA